MPKWVVVYWFHQIMFHPAWTSLNRVHSILSTRPFSSLAGVHVDPGRPSSSAEHVRPPAEHVEPEEIWEHPVPQAALQ